MDENKVIRPMDFVRLTNIDELNNFFKSWHEEYEYWADNEDAIREELHHNQYEDRLYYENGDVYVEPLNEIA